MPLYTTGTENKLENLQKDYVYFCDVGLQQNAEYARAEALQLCEKTNMTIPEWALPLVKKISLLVTMLMMGCVSHFDVSPIATPQATAATVTQDHCNTLDTLHIVGTSAGIAAAGIGTGLSGLAVAETNVNKNIMISALITTGTGTGLTALGISAGNSWVDECQKQAVQNAATKLTLKRKQEENVK
jgi:hypothetical protein